MNQYYGNQQQQQQLLFRISCFSRAFVLLECIAGLLGVTVHPYGWAMAFDKVSIVRPRKIQYIPVVHRECIGAIL